jgi:UDP-N-acetylbacillosamine transaminase
VIYLSPPHMGDNELKYINEVFKSNFIAPVGKFIDRFEESVKLFSGSQNALAVVNGTSAIHLALKILGIKEHDRVLTSSFTFIGSVSPIIYQRAEPVFIDSDSSWNIDPNLAEDAIKKEKPKALIVTHLYGQMAKIEELLSLAKQYGVYLIEDAAESLGATYKNKQSGTFGDFGVYSFNGNKIITTSSGGMLISNRKDWIDRARFLSTQAKEPFDWYEHKEIGFNYRMSNVLAAIGVAQMEVLNKRIERRRTIFSMYKNNLSDIADFMPEIKHSRGNRWLTTLTFKDKNPMKVLEVLRKNKIESRPLWKPMHLQSVFKECKSYNNGVCEDLFKKGLCLPSGSALKDEEIERICELVKTA